MCECLLTCVQGCEDIFLILSPLYLVRCAILTCVKVSHVEVNQFYLIECKKPFNFDTKYLYIEIEYLKLFQPDVTVQLDTWLILPSNMSFMFMY